MAYLWFPGLWADPAVLNRWREVNRQRERTIEQIQPDGRRLIDYTVEDLRALPRERQKAIAEPLVVDLADLLSSKWRKGQGLMRSRQMIRPKSMNEMQLAKVG